MGRTSAYRCAAATLGRPACNIGIISDVLDEAVRRFVTARLGYPNAAVLRQTSDDAERVKRSCAVNQAAWSLSWRWSSAKLSASRNAAIAQELEEDLGLVQDFLTRMPNRDALGSLLFDLASPFGIDGAAEVVSCGIVTERVKLIQVRFDAFDIRRRRAVVKEVCQEVRVDSHPVGVKPSAEPARVRIAI